MKNRMLIAAALIAALAGGSPTMGAQGPRLGAGPHGGPHRGLRGGTAMDLRLHGVGLTESQREQVRSIRETHRAEFADLRNKLAGARRALVEAARADVVDEAAIRTHSTAVANAMADEAILRARVRAQVHSLLTAEQQQQRHNREAQMQQRLQERQERLKQRRPPQ